MALELDAARPFHTEDFMLAGFASSDPLINHKVGGGHAFDSKTVSRTAEAALGASAVKEVLITKWSTNPFIKGAWSYAPVNSSVKDWEMADAGISMALSGRYTR